MNHFLEAFADETGRVVRLIRVLVLLVALAGTGVVGGVMLTQHPSADECSEIPQTEGNAQFREGFHATPQRLPTDGEPSTLEEVAVDEQTDGVDTSTGSSADESIDDAPTQASANARMLGDRLLRERAVDAAVRQYRNLPLHDDAESVEIRYRLSLCAEALGNWQSALDGYRQVAEVSREDELTELAQLGQARVLRRLGATDDAQRLLYRWILHSHPAMHRSPGTTVDALYLLASVVAQSTAPASALWEPDGLCVPVSTFVPGDVLPGAGGQPDELSVSDETGLHVTHRLADNDPDSLSLTGHTGSTVIRRAVEQLCEVAGWEFHWSPQAANAARGRTVHLDFIEQGAGQVLDALLTPLGLEWEYRSGMVAINLREETAPDTLRELQRERAERCLLAALIAEPNHPQTANVYLLLGNLAFQQMPPQRDRQTEVQETGSGLQAATDTSPDPRFTNHEPARCSHLSAARRHYRHIIETDDWAALHAEAWFNLAKVSIREGNLTESHEAVLRAMDAGHGHPLEPAALLLAGWQRLAMDQPREAARPLQRAVTLASTDDLRALARLSLSAAYLIDDNPQAANLVLRERRHGPWPDAYRDQAAFLSSLARFRATSTSRRRTEAGHDLLSALSHVMPNTGIGLHGQLLFVQACHELGLTDTALPVLKSVSEAEPVSPLQTRILMLFVDYLLTEGDDVRAQALLETLRHSSRRATSAAAELRLAELEAASGNEEHASRTCQSLLPLTSDPETKTAALRLLGKIYARRGDHERATLCFSGINPSTVERSGPSATTLPPQTRRPDATTGE